MNSNWKDAVMAKLKVAYYPSIRPEEFRKTAKNTCQYSRSPGRDLKQNLPEYDAGVLTTRPRRSVLVGRNIFNVNFETHYVPHRTQSALRLLEPPIMH
jgi:hypothetical protein